MLCQYQMGDGLVPSSTAPSGLCQARRSSEEASFLDIIPLLPSQHEPGDTPRAACVPARFRQAQQICLFSAGRDEPGRQVAGTESSWSAHTRRAEGARASAAADCHWWGDRLHAASSLGIYRVPEMGIFMRIPLALNVGSYRFQTKHVCGSASFPGPEVRKPTSVR